MTHFRQNTALVQNRPDANPFTRITTLGAGGSIT